MGLITTTNLEFIQEKLFSFPIALSILLLLPPIGVGDAYLILGHAHFMMTALYQYKMGRITNLSIALYLVLFACLFFVAYHQPQAFTLFVAIALLFHVYQGEARHIKKPFSLPYLFMTLGIGALIGPWLAMELWPLNLSPLIPLLSSALLVFAACAFFIRKHGRQVELLFYTLVGVYLIFVAAELLGFRPSGLQSFGFIVIAHYMATYFNVYRSFTRKGEGKQWLFILESMGMNLLFLAGYILVYYFMGVDNNPLYDYVYHPIAFYVWTLMHFITTMDLNKYKAAIAAHLVVRKTE